MKTPRSTDEGRGDAPGEIADPGFTFRKALGLWFKIGCIGFGGPSGQIAILHREVVEKSGLIGEAEFVRALQFCMFLPGPEAQQLATWIGWRLHGIKGGILAGCLFVLPSALLLWALSLLYVLGSGWPSLHAFFVGLKPAVLAIVAAALWKIARRTLTSIPLGVLAVLALGLLFLNAPYPAVVIAFGLFGSSFLSKPEALPPTASLRGKKESWSGSFRIALAVLAAWILPIGALHLWLGPEALPARIGFFFGKVALFSFGGAYAALSYVSLHAASDWGWVTPAQMMDGLGLAETTPGPLLIALQFVAFIASYNAPGSFQPLVAATLGSIAAVWALFLPSFLWIFALAPHMERISRNHRVAGALSAIGAVVTAVIACLAIRFAGSLVFVRQEIAWLPLLMAVAFFLALRSKVIGIVPAILISGGLGMLLDAFSRHH